MITIIVLLIMLMLFTHKKAFLLPIYCLNKVLLAALICMILISKILLVNKNRVTKRIYIVLFLDPLAFLYANTLPSVLREKKS